MPVQAQILWTTGDILLWADLDLLLKDLSGAFHRRPFRVDSGTQITTMEAFAAKQLGIPMPVAPSAVRHQPTGLELRSGILRFRVDGMDATEYAVPCFFLGDPNAPPRGLPGALPRELFQPLSLIDRLRFTLDHDPSDGTAHGRLLVEKK